jgi:hypothetical protein
MSDFDVPEACPHCDEPQLSRQMDAHVARAHADLPPCTARIETEHRETYRCAFRAGHTKGEYGLWHASTCEAPLGRYVWHDTAAGATPHRAPESSGSLDKLRAMGVLSHTVVATGDNQRQRRQATACSRPECGGEIHTDQWGTAVRCLHQPPQLLTLAEQAVSWTATQPPPPTIVINGGDGTPLVTIHPDGVLEYGPGYDPDETARCFWDALRRLAPARCPACGHVGLETT